MGNGQVVPTVKVVSLYIVGEEVLTGLGLGIGLLEVDFTNADEVSQLNALTRLNGALLPAETKTAVIANIVRTTILLHIELRVAGRIVYSTTFFTRRIVDCARVLTHDLIGMPVAAVEAEPVVINGGHTSNVLTKEDAQQRGVGIGRRFHLDTIGSVGRGGQHLQGSLIVGTNHDVGPNTGIDGHRRGAIVGHGVNNTSGNIALRLKSCCHSHITHISSIQGIHIGRSTIVHLESSNETCTGLGSGIPPVPNRGFIFMLKST